MTAVLRTYFDRSLVTMFDAALRAARKQRWNKSWETYAREVALEKGGIAIWKGDDTMIVFTRLSDGSIRKDIHRPGSWGFEDERKEV
jgi:hypothetical protein